MSIITLTTDYGLKDPYVGMLKGALYKEYSEAHVIDITHLISPFHVTETAYIIQNAYRNFPDGTIHIIDVDAERTPDQQHVVVHLNNHYFICADNGVLSLIVNKFIPTKMVAINLHNHLGNNVTTTDVFIKAACHIARGGTLELIGDVITQLKEIIPILAKIDKNDRVIYGQVIYINNYGNAITNITRDLMKEVGKGRAFTMAARSAKFNVVYERYADLIYGDKLKKAKESDGLALAVYNSVNHVEIATYKSNPLTVGSASSLLGLQVDAPVLVTFDPI